jgi:orotidine-5'-phosphate decarboxylase
MSAVPGSAFGDRLHNVFASSGHLCVGIDPHQHLLREWALEDTAAGAREFGLRVVDAAVGHVGLVKPQVAFFERFGSVGYAALEAVIRSARSAGLLVIADAKRGDIGTSVTAYAEAWLAQGSPLESDAMTISAFQGVGSLNETMLLAEQSGKGLFVLAATSNPEAAVIQRATTTEPAGSHRSVARAIIDDVAVFNEKQISHGYGSVGVVIGATLDLATFGIDTSVAPVRNPTPVLAPGFGHQGAQLSDARRIFGAYASSIVVSESRSVLKAGPDGIGSAIRTRAAEVRETLG